MGDEDLESDERWIWIRILSARHLPTTSVVGALRSLNCKVTCCDNEFQTRSCPSLGSCNHSDTEGYKATWNQEFRCCLSQQDDAKLTIRLYGNSSASAEPGMHLKSFIGEISLHIARENPENPFQKPFTVVQSKMRANLCGPCTILISSVEWINLIRDKDPVCTPAGSLAAIQIQLQLEHCVRDIGYIPTQTLLEAASRSPLERTPEDVSLIAAELSLHMTSAVQYPAKLLISLAEVAELTYWKQGDVVELQPNHASESSLHFVVSGRFRLFSHQNGPNMAMYKILRGRITQYETSFGPSVGWRGPGEIFGEGALLCRGGLSATALCDSASGCSLSVNGRICQEIMEQFRKTELIFSMDVQVRSVLNLPSDERSNADLAKITSLLKSLEFKSAFSLTDEMMLEIARRCLYEEIEQDGVLLGMNADSYAVICCGTASVHLQKQPPKRFRSVCFPFSECIDMLSAGRLWGFPGSEELCIVSRERMSLIWIPKDALHPFLQKEEFNDSTPRCDGRQLNANTFWYFQRPGRCLASMVLDFKALKNSAFLRSLEDSKLWHLVQTECVVPLDGTIEASGKWIFYIYEGTLLVNCSKEIETLDGYLESGKRQYLQFVMSHRRLFERRERRAGDLIGAHETFVSQTAVRAAVWDLFTFVSCITKNESTERLTQYMSNAGPKTFMNAPILKGIPQNSFLALPISHRTHNFRAGEILVLNNHPCAQLYFVVEGSVALCSHPNLCPSGKLHFRSCLTSSDLILQASFGHIQAIVRSGQYFGQIEFLLRCKSCFTAVCLADTILLTLSSGIEKIEPLIWANIREKRYVCTANQEISWEQIELKGLKLYKEVQDLPGSKIFDKLAVRAGVFQCKQYILENLECHDSGESSTIRNFSNSAHFAAIKSAEITEKQRLVRLMLSKMPLFKALQISDFHRFARSSRILAFDREEEIFNPLDIPENIMFLVSGEVKVIQRASTSVTCVIMGPGACFGKLNGQHQTQPEESNVRWIVFANTECFVLRIPVKEIQTTLSQQSMAMLKKEIESSNDIASKPPAPISMSKANISEYRPLSAEPLNVEGTMRSHNRPATSQGFSTEHDVRRGSSSGRIAGGSKALRVFMEQVAMGKIRPSRCTAMIGTGPLPEEILPSLQTEYRKSSSLGENQDKSQLSDTFAGEQDAKIKLFRKVVRYAPLKLLDSRIQRLRSDPSMRKSLKNIEWQESIENQRKETLLSGGQNFRKRNVAEAADPTSKDQRRMATSEKSAAALECIKTHKEENERRFEEKVNKTLSAINRRESNEQRIIQRMEDAQRKASVIKLIAQWLVLVALCRRTSDWTAVLSKVRHLREDFLTWTAAASCIQKAYQCFRAGHMGKRRAAAKVIAKYARKCVLSLRIKRKRHAIRVIQTAVAQYQLLKHDIRFFISRLYCMVTRLQRFIRSCIETTKAQIANIMRLWTEFENKLLKQLFSQMRLKAKRSSLKGVRIPQNLRVEAIRNWLKQTRRKVARERAQWKVDVVKWKQDFKWRYADWQYRLLMHHQRELFSGETVAEVTGPQPREHAKSISMIEPPYPAFPPRPADDEMSKIVKAAYDKTMVTFHDELTVKRNSVYRRGSTESLASVASRRR